MDKREVLESLAVPGCELVACFLGDAKPFVKVAMRETWKQRIKSALFEELKAEGSIVLKDRIDHGNGVVSEAWVAGGEG